MRSQLEVHLHTNYSCNLLCRHCYNNSGGRDRDVLPKALVIDIITALCAAYDAEFHLEGGEIFMCPELLEHMDALPDSILRRITITTNGTIHLENPKILSVLKRIGVLRVSVEGHTDAQQHAVRAIGLAPVFDTALYYKHLGVPITFRVTLSSVNYDQFVEKTIPGLMEQGGETLQVYEFQSVGRGSFDGARLALGASIEELLIALEAHGAFSDGTVKFMFPKGRLSEIYAHREALRRSGFTVQPVAPENSISIHADGGVYVCPWDNDRSHCLFNIKEMDLRNVQERLDQEDLTHTCEHCSAVRIVC